MRTNVSENQQEREPRTNVSENQQDQGVRTNKSENQSFTRPMNRPEECDSVTNVETIEYVDFNGKPQRRYYEKKSK